MKNIFNEIGASLQTPMGMVFTINVLWHIIVLAAGIISFNYLYLAIGFILLLGDMIVVAFISDKLVYFFSQFVLPIQNPKDRNKIYLRVKTLESGRGPALFIKNGRVIMHPGEADKRGPGVIVLDTASAAVLRTDTEIRDTVGPGIKFTEKNEYIAGSVDLRPQLQFIGPLANNQSFLHPVPIVAPIQETSGWTRDGFEVFPTISVKFCIKRPEEKIPTESGVTSQYGYDETSVRNAITRETIQLGKGEKNKSRLEWNNLPAHLVVNLWREYVRKFKLGDLFKTEDNALQTITKMINARLKQRDVIGLDDIGKPNGEWVESMEFRQLETRGLEIMDVRIHNVTYESSMEEKTVQEWSAEWLKTAQTEQAQLKEMETLTETAAREEALKQFAEVASQPFGAKPTLPQNNPFKTLQLLIAPLKESMLASQGSNPDMEADLRKMEEIWKWLLDNNPNGAQRPGEGKL